MFDFGVFLIMFFFIIMVVIVNLFVFVCGFYGVFVWGEGFVFELMLVSFVVVNSLLIYMVMLFSEDDGKLLKNVCILVGIFICFVVVLGFFVFK